MDDSRAIRNLIVVAALIIVVGAFVSSKEAGTVLRTGILSNLPSALIAVVLGIPIALQINRAQTEHGRQAQEATRAARARLRKMQILAILETELREAETRLRDRCEEVVNPFSGATEASRRSIVMPMISDQFCQSIAQSGDLEYIEDPGLLDTLGTAYHFLAENRRLEQSYYERTMRFGLDHASVSKAPLLVVDSLALRAVREAIGAVNELK